MARTCYRCKGRGWVGYKAQTLCPVCGGTREDPNWGDRTCRLCSTVFEYNRNWKNHPEYCDFHRQDQYKSCANPHCSGTIRYKAFWDNIPDYCQQCKGWYTMTCQNPHCGQQFQAHCKWTDPPKYCKSCKGWYEKDCATKGCSDKVRIHCEWNRPSEYCETCKKLGGKNRDPWQDPRNRIEPWVNKETGQMNQKIVSGPDTGLHRYYDKARRRSGQTGTERF